LSNSAGFFSVWELFGKNFYFIPFAGKLKTSAVSTAGSFMRNYRNVGGDMLRPCEDKRFQTLRIDKLLKITFD